MDTHFTVVFERPEGYEDVHSQLCAEDHIIDYPGMKWEAADGNLIQRCDMLLEALKKISSPTQTENLTWWQNEARVAIAAVENQK